MYGFCMLLLILVCCRQLLANLWARHAALQCCFNQASLDLFIPYYTGCITGDSVFDPAALSGVVVQVKYKANSALDRKFGHSKGFRKAVPRVFRPKNNSQRSSQAALSTASPRFSVNGLSSQRSTWMVKSQRRIQSDKPNSPLCTLSPSQLTFPAIVCAGNRTLSYLVLPLFSIPLQFLLLKTKISISSLSSVSCLSTTHPNRSSFASQTKQQGLSVICGPITTSLPSFWSIPSPPFR
jgi:hypothetical protein